MNPGREYLNFDLVIEPIGDKYRARVINSPSGQATVEFNKPFSALELENFVLRMGQSRSGVRRIDSPEMQAAKGLGRHLFTTVFSGEVNSCYLRSVDQVRSQNKGLRVRLHINVPEFNNLPWEFLYDPQFDRFVTLSEITPIIRYLELPYTTRALPIHAPLKILVLISSPEEYPKLDVQKEWEMLNQALKPLLDRKSVVLERLEHPTLGALQKTLRKEKVHIFHFIGHGKYFEDKQDGMLLLEDEKGRGRPTSGQYLGTILQDHYPLRLVVLNACEGARTSAEDPYAGVAQTLVRQGIHAVLAMQFVIFEDAAITFAKEFYSAIVDNYPVDAALSEARKAIFTSNNDVEWGTPVLFMRTPDGVLFMPESEEDRTARLETEREKQELLRKEAAERLARQKAMIEKAEREAAEKEAREKAEREAAEREAVEKAAKEKAGREAAKIDSWERVKSEAAKTLTAVITKPKLLVLTAFVFIVICFIVGNSLGWFSPSPVVPASTGEPIVGTTPQPTKTFPPPAETAPTMSPTETRSALTSPEIIDDFGVEMVLIPVGTFTMGDEGGQDDEKPEHQVYLDAFYIDKYEVSNLLYKACVDAGVCDPPRSNGSRLRSDYYINPQYDNYPVIYVVWSMAETFCKTWRGGGLPTEAQWEKAARGGLERKKYPWGDEAPVCQKGAQNGSKFDDNNLCKDTDTEKVGSYSPNGYGLYDMAGNVWEWIADTYTADYYTISSSSNPTGSINGTHRVLRGGSWSSFWNFQLVANRKRGDPTGSEDNIGFRCARSIP